MFPALQYLLQSRFGTPITQWLGVIKTFGLFVAIAFIISSYILVSGLKREEQQGLLKPERIGGRHTSHTGRNYFNNSCTGGFRNNIIL